MSYEIEYLKNDIPVYLDKTNSNTLGIAIIVETGSIYEEPKYRGISHLLEHMMFKTNKKYKAEEINKMLELNGGISNAFTSRFQTVYLVEVLPEGFAKVVDVLYSMFESEDYINKEFELEKKVVLSEIEMHENNPEDKIEDLLMLSIYGNSDYGESIAGYRETISNITKDVLIEYKLKTYVPENMKILLIGNVNNEHIKLLDNTFGDLPEGHIKKKTPSKGKSKDIEESMDTKNQVYAGIGIRIPIKETYKIESSGILLYGGLSSITFNIFRERYGIGYSTFAGIFDKFPDEIVFSFVTYGFERDRVDDYFKAIEESIETLYKSSEDYIVGRRKHAKIKMEKTANNIFKRLYIESELLSLFEETFEEYMDKVFELNPKEGYDLIKDLDKYSRAFIYPIS